MKEIAKQRFEHPTDGFYHLEPKGEHPNAPTGVTQVIDAAAIKAIVSNFNADAAKSNLSHGDSMLIDQEHFSHDLTKATTAFGWLTGLQGRDDGIYGKIRWTDTGKAAVDGGSYRFFSTEYNPADVIKMNGDEKRVRPMKLAGLTLTNRPNNRGAKPITNCSSSVRNIDSERAVLIRNRAISFFKSKGALSLASAFALAQEEAAPGDSARLIRNRAEEIIKHNPNTHTITAYQQAMREISRNS